METKKLFWISILLTIVIRLPWIFIPFLIPDTADMMAVAGQIVKDGAIYGRDFLGFRGPGSYFITAIITYIFGYGNTLAFNIIGILVNILILCLLRQLTSQLLNEQIANIACIVYAVFSYSYILHDMIPLNVEIMAQPFLLVSIILFYRGIRQSQNGSLVFLSFTRFFFTGFFVAIIFAIKQVIAGCLGVYFLMVILSLYNKDIRFPQALKIIIFTAIGFILGIVLIFGYSFATIGWNDTIYWIVLFGMRHYIWGPLGKISSCVQRVLLMFIAQPLLWTLPFLWIVSFIMSFKRLAPETKQPQLFILFMALIEWLGALIAGRFNGHYFIPAMAFMSIMASDMLIRSYELAKNLNSKLGVNCHRYFITAVIIIGFLPALLNYTVFPEGVQTLEYSVHPLFYEKLFQDQDPISRAVDSIRKNTSGEDRIFVLGLPYEFYPLSKRLPATVAFGLQWFELRKNDNYLTKIYGRIINSLGKNPPEAIVLPCPAYSGIVLSDDAWDDIRKLLKERYDPPKRFAWNSRLKFFRGKYKLMENVDEWVDVYFSKNRDVKNLGNY